MSDRLYIARIRDGKEFDWVEDVLTTIGKKEIDYLLRILNEHVENQNGDWDQETEDCLNTLEYLESYLETGKKYHEK